VTLGATPRWEDDLPLGVESPTTRPGVDHPLIRGEVFRQEETAMLSAVDTSPDAVTNSIGR